jgi:hypothetical protein
MTAFTGVGAGAGGLRTDVHARRLRACSTQECSRHVRGDHASPRRDRDDSTSNRQAEGIVWKAEWTAPLGGSLLATARAGQFVVQREDAPYSTSPRFEDLATPTVQGGNRTWREDLRRTQVSGSLGYLHEGRGGRHQLTVSGEGVRLVAAETGYRSYAGDVLQVLRDGEPAEVYLFQAPSQSRSGQWWYSAALSDAVNGPRHRRTCEALRDP